MAKILYVESDRDRAEKVRPVLEEHDHVVDVVNCAERAMLRVSNGESYEALVLQLYLPGMDGAELCRWFDRWSAVGPIPKLAFTWAGNRMPVDISDGLPRWLPVELLLEDVEDERQLVEALEGLLAQED